MPTLAKKRRKATPEQSQLAASNIGLAYHFARRQYWLVPSSPLEELEGQAMVSLTKAAIYFNPTLNVKFSTYAGAIIVRDLIRWVSQ